MAHELTQSDVDGARRLIAAFLSIAKRPTHRDPDHLRMAIDFAVLARNVLGTSGDRAYVDVSVVADASMAAKLIAMTLAIYEDEDDPSPVGDSCRHLLDRTVRLLAGRDFAGPGTYFVAFASEPVRTKVADSEIPF